MNASSLFVGFSRSFADDIVNFGDDVDGDGVNKFQDDCPSVKADTANGCPKVLNPAPPADPVDPDAPAPAPEDAPDPNAPAPDAPAPDPSAPAGPQAGNTGTPFAPSGAAAAQVGPVITIGGVGSQLRRSKLTGRLGVKAKIACSTECRYTAKLVVKNRGRKQSTTVLRRSGAQFSAKTRDVQLRVSASKLRKLSSKKITLVVEATDRAGNRRTVSKVVGLR